MEMTFDPPTTRRVRPPMDYDVPGPSVHTGGNCKCACHTERVQLMISLALAVFGTMSYALGWLGRRSAERQ